MRRIWFLVILVSLLILVLAPMSASAQSRHGFGVQPSFPHALGNNVGRSALPSLAVPRGGLQFRFHGHFGTPGFHGRFSRRHFRFHHHPRFNFHPRFRKFRFHHQFHPRFRTFRGHRRFRGFFFHFPRG